MIYHIKYLMCLHTTNFEHFDPICRILRKAQRHFLAAFVGNWQNSKHVHLRLNE